jgi:lysophospholipase L1-like esterase
VRPLIVLAGLLLGVLITPLPSAAAEPPVYVALGDSYASGVGTGSYLDDGSGCLRSSYAYPGLLAQQHGYTLRFRACAGATIDHVRAVQLGALDEGTSLVTLSVGGNDAGFAEVLTTCAAPWWLARCDPAVDLARRIVRDELPGRLRLLYAEVRDRAPHARVVVVGYPHVFMGEDCDLGTWFSRAEQQRLNATGDQLNARIAAAARAAGFSFADPTAAFAGHAVCDDTAWVNGLSLPIGDSYHPSTAGHAEGLLPLVASLLVDAAPRRGRAPVPSAPTARREEVRAAPFRAPDLDSRRARRAAERHGIDIEKWLATHP